MTNQIFFLQTVFGYVEFERQIQQCFSKCEPYKREREREREREADKQRPVERGCKKIVEYASPFFLTDTQISGDSALVYSVFMKTATATFVLALLIIKAFTPD